MKRLVSIFALLLSMIMIFTACGGNKTEVEKSSDEEKPKKTQVTTEAPDTEAIEGIFMPDEKVTIEFWHALSDINGEVLESIISKFNNKYKNIEIKPVFQGHYRDLFEKLNNSAQAGSLPTITMIYNNRLSAYVLNDLAENLDDHIFDEKYGFKKEVWDDIPTALRDGGTWDGVRYSLPFNKSAYMMFYNVDALEEKGIAVPTTWEELREAGKKLSEPGKPAIAFNKSVGIDSSYWVEQAGGHIYDEATDTVMINTPETKEAYEFLIGLVQDGYAQVCFEENYMTGPFSRREALIGFSSTSALPNIKEACKETGVNWKAAKLPAGKKSAALFAGTSIAMYNTSSDIEKKAAFEFIKYWFELDSQVEWGIKSGYLTLRNSAINDPRYIEYLNTDDSKKTASEQFDYAYEDPKVLNGYAIHNNMQEALEEVLAGSKTLDQALDDAQKEAVEALEEAKKNFGN